MSIVPYDDRPSHIFVLRKTGNILKKQIPDRRINIFEVSTSQLTLDKLRKTIDSLQQENYELLEKLNENLSTQRIEHLENIIESYKVDCLMKGKIQLLTCGENLKRNKCSNCRTLNNYLHSINVI